MPPSQICEILLASAFLPRSFEDLNHTDKPRNSYPQDPYGAKLAICYDNQTSLTSAHGEYIDHLLPTLLNTPV